MPKKKKEEQQEIRENPEEAVEESKKTEEPEKEDERDSIIESLTGENEQLKDAVLRKTAEFDNFKKRTQREKEALYEESKADTLTGLLPVLDNFERALAFPVTAENEEFKKGIEMIFVQLKDHLKKLSVEEIPAVGETFDPLVHNAVMHVEDESVGENVIVEELQKGYRIGDRVLRHSMVKVAN